MKSNTLFLFPVVFGILLSSACIARAVEPVAINEGSGVNWSSPINDEFDGFVVYDKHSLGDNTIVSSWSKKAIKLTVSREFSKVTGSRQERSCKTSKDTNNCRVEEVPTYTKYTKSYQVSNFTISINSRLYRYDQGAVSRPLAQALANAPTSKNARIRILTTNGFTVDSEIGVGTVKAWQQIFR
jgi:hypothetical protein